MMMLFFYINSPRLIIVAFLASIIFIFLIIDIDLVCTYQETDTRMTRSIYVKWHHHKVDPVFEIYKEEEGYGHKVDPMLEICKEEERHHYKVEPRVIPSSMLEES